MNDMAGQGGPQDATPSVLFQVIGRAHHLESHLEAALAKIGLSMAKMGVLEPLARSEEALTLGQLADRVHCVKSNITQLVDRLETDGLVRRLSDLDDRRVRRASLTPAGRKAHAEGVQVIAAQERATAAVLDGREAESLGQLLGRLGP